MGPTEDAGQRRFAAGKKPAVFADGATSYRADAPEPLAIVAAMDERQQYHLRAPISKREAVVALDRPPDPDEHVYLDGRTGERMEAVGKLLPLASSPSNLLRSPENLRVCPFCEELVERDLSECPYCRRRLPALRRGG